MAYLQSLLLLEGGAAHCRQLLGGCIVPVSSCCSQRRLVVCPLLQVAPPGFPLAL